MIVSGRRGLGEKNGTPMGRLGQGEREVCLFLFLFFKKKKQVVSGLICGETVWQLHGGVGCLRWQLQESVA